LKFSILGVVIPIGYRAPERAPRSRRIRMARALGRRQGAGLWGWEAIEGLIQI
jgi:hypothetical protein